ncbi:MAG: hypothetical protein ACE5H4_13525 [Candidatus Thorarchaeota archaeon]
MTELACIHCGATADRHGKPWKNKRALNTHQRFCKGKSDGAMVEHPFSTIEDDTVIPHPFDEPEPIVETDVQEMVESMEAPTHLDDEIDLTDEEDENEWEEMDEPVERPRHRPRREPTPEAPDVYEKLERLLIYWDMPKRDASRFVHMFKTRELDLDNLWDFIELAEEMVVSWNPTSQRMFLQDWVAKRGLEVPYDLEDRIYRSKQTWTGPTRRTPSRPGRGEFGGRYQQDNPASQMREMIQTFKEMKAIIEPEGSYDDSERERELELENEKLQRRIDRLEEKLERRIWMDETVRPLEDKIRDLETRQRDRTWSEQVEGEMIDTFRDVRSSTKAVKDWLLQGAQAVYDAGSAPPTPSSIDDIRESTRLMSEELERLGAGEFMTYGEPPEQEVE